MGTTIDITGLDKAGLLLRLYRASVPVEGVGALAAMMATRTLTYKDAQQLIKRSGAYIDTIHGRAIKMSFDSDTHIQARSYEELNGVGQAQAVVDAMRASSKRAEEEAKAPLTPGYVDVKGLDKPELLAALFNKATPRANEEERRMTRYEAAGLLDMNPIQQFYTVYGRPLHVHLISNTEFNPKDYDAANGAGAAQAVANAVRDRGPWTERVQFAKDIGMDHQQL